MGYPSFDNLENLKNSKRIGANLYDVFIEELSAAVKVFEQSGLKIAQIIEHEEEERNYTFTYYFLVVDWEEKK